MLPDATALRQIVRMQVQTCCHDAGALAAAGIDFSVSEADMTDWLNNPEFTPYPALAEALLTLLGGKRLRRPVFLDVIVFNYEHSPGNPSPRTVEDVDVAVLAAAVVEGSNNRYGEAVSDVRDLLLVERGLVQFPHVRLDRLNDAWRMRQLGHLDPDGSAFVVR